MAILIQGEIEIHILQTRIDQLLPMMNIVLITDFAEFDSKKFDYFFDYYVHRNHQHVWTQLEFSMCFNIAFEFEEYLAYQLNKKYHWVTVADCYRLMADRLQGDVCSGYYSILFEQNNSIYLVDNSTFDDETNSLLFTKLACISPPSAQKTIKDPYQFAEYAQQPYIGYKLEDGVFYPVMKSEYLVLQLPDLLQRWHKNHS
ncbi:hypothetical protein [Acinetobacter sp. CFCC 10889]|uniref:hypothetical protein n=1 Tax=Acinetobacter sp. CFCC 10889 TaxID=1775557 RepID=UPI000DD0997C|nr:hypothetical protein [Acinetobacter sp. CFCC 10889]